MNADALERMSVTHYRDLDDFEASLMQSLDEILRSSDGAEPLRVNFPDVDNQSEAVGRSYNCQNCAVAFELASRGYNVVARPMPDCSSVGDMTKYFVGAELIAMGEAFDEVTLDALGYAQNIYLQYKAFRRKHGTANGSRIRKKFRRALDELMFYVSYENKVVGLKIRDWIAELPYGARGFIITGYFDSLDPMQRTTRFHVRNWVHDFSEAGFTVYDAQNYERIVKDFLNLDADELQKLVDPRDIYIMRTDNLLPTSKVCEAVITRELEQNL